MALEFQGSATAPYTMFYGSLAATSIPAAGQFVDLNFLSTFGTLIDGLGIGLTSGALPAILGVTGATGFSNWSVPLNPSSVGLTLCFQGAMLDPSTALGFNITGAPEFTVVPVPPVNVVITGDDILQTVTLGAPVSLYGFSSSDVSVSTNGWFSLTNLATSSDLGETTSRFLDGSIGFAPIGSAPAVAVLWEDLDVGNGVPGQQLNVIELAPGILELTWVNADYFPNTPFGTIRCTLDTLAQTVTMDYTGYSTAAPPIEGIVGVSDGGTTGFATASEQNLAVGGSVALYTSAAPPESVFQNFGIGPFPEPFDLGGNIITFQDVGAGAGAWIVF